MSAMWDRLADLLRAGEPVAVATIVEARGSTPREVGTSMIVGPDGAVAGTVGGGVGEALVLEQARRAIAEGASRACVVDLAGEAADPDARACGGIVEVFVDCVRNDRPVLFGLDDVAAVDEIRVAQGRARKAALAVVLRDPGGVAGVRVGTKWVARDDGTLLGAVPRHLESRLAETVLAALRAGRSGRQWLMEEGATGSGTERRSVALFVHVIEPRPHLVILGAGHIAMALARMAKLVDLDVTVADDRAAYATRERFPDVDRLIVGRVEEALREVPVGPATSVVLVGPSHEHDERALAAVLPLGPAYVGMIGSGRKIREVFRNLTAAGIAESELAKVHAPIGLAIGAQTPAEIAVAIIAELVQVRRAGEPGA
jgi:xanthine dehydrogenase accessory factor